jgi:LAO/AO transport system kinase
MNGTRRVSEGLATALHDDNFHTPTARSPCEGPAPSLLLLDARAPPMVSPPPSTPVPPPLDTELPPGLRPLLEGVRAGDRRLLARAISVVENERAGFEALLHALLQIDADPEGASAPMHTTRVGITGPPGAGKSSLVTGMARTLAEEGSDVGIVAVDPTSPYSGGALLGDRIRMNDLALDPRIFIRSMASRGSLGGLATTTTEVLDLMDAAGFPHILVETVGVGQTELEIAGTADTVVVVLVPESGDGIQAMKAGLMEIADLFVVNKSDRPGADRLVREIRSALHYRTGQADRTSVPAHHGVELTRVPDPSPAGDAKDPDAPEPWTPPVLQTIAHAGEGIPELLEAVASHGAWLRASGELARRRTARTATRIRDVMDRELKRRVRRLLAAPGVLDDALGAVARDPHRTPYAEAARLLTLLSSETEAP